MIQSRETNARQSHRAQHEASGPGMGPAHASHCTPHRTYKEITAKMYCRQVGLLIFLSSNNIQEEADVLYFSEI